MLIYISEWMIYLMIFIKKKILGINIDIIYRFFVYDFFKGRNEDI